MKQKVERGNKESQEAKRLLVAGYLRKKIGTHKQAATIFQLSKSAVDKIWMRYRLNGKQGLTAKKRGGSSRIKLNSIQVAEVKRLIIEKLPEQLKLSYGLWTRDAVEQLIFKKFGVQLSRWQVARYLKAWGYASQKPVSRSFEQEYPAIMKRAKKEKAVFYFGNKTRMHDNNEADNAFATKGETPEIKKTESRFSLCNISAVSNKGHLLFMIITGRFNSRAFETFLKQLIKYSQQKIYFVTYSNSDHKTRKIRKWLKTNKKSIEVFFLPSYNSVPNYRKFRPLWRSKKSSIDLKTKKE